MRIRIQEAIKAEIKAVLEVTKKLDELKFFNLSKFVVTFVKDLLEISCLIFNPLDLNTDSNGA